MLSFWRKENNTGLHALKITGEGLTLVTNPLKPGTYVYGSQTNFPDFLKGKMQGEISDCLGKEILEEAIKYVTENYRHAPARVFEKLIGRNECPICNALPAYTKLRTHYRRGEGEETEGECPPEEQVSKLIVVTGLQHTGKDLRRCPLCMTYYSFESFSDSDIGERWDEYTFARISHEQAYAIIKEYQPAEADLLELYFISPGKKREFSLEGDPFDFYYTDIPVYWTAYGGKEDFFCETTVDGRNWKVRDLLFPDWEYVYHLVIDDTEVYGLMDWPEAWGKLR